MGFDNIKDNVEMLEDRITKKGYSPKVLSQKLHKYNSVVGKLEFLKKIYESELKLLNSEVGHNYYFDSVHTMVKKTQAEHFPNTKDVEFTFWFLQYHAEIMYHDHIRTDDFKEDISDDERIHYIEGELMKIAEDEEKARLLYRARKIDSRLPNRPERGYLYQSNNKEVEIHRILKSYYTKNPTEHPFTTIRSPEVEAYFRHKMLKPYLENLLSEFMAGEDQKSSTAPKWGEAKFYALLHWILIELGVEKSFEKNENDLYPASYIKRFAENKYDFKDGQIFYYHFTNINIKNKSAFAKIFGKDYKEKVIAISNNDAKVISHLKDYPS